MVVAVVVMANLSLWQVNRLNERRATNDAITSRTSEPVADVDAVVADGLTADELQYRRLTVTGTYLRGDGGTGAPLEVLIANQTFGGAPGWWVVTPLRTLDGNVVLVNRGWVPFASAVPGDNLDEVAPPTGAVTVTGVAQLTQSAVTGVAPDAAALPRLDVATLAGRIDGGADVLPVWLQLATQSPAQPSGQPLAVELPPLDDGPHVNYAGQWAIFASLTAIVYLVLVVRTAQRGGDGAGTARRASASRSTPPDLRVMLAVRLAPLTPVDRLAVVGGVRSGDVVETLDALVASGDARFHDADPRGWTLTPSGHAVLTARLADELDAAGCRDEMLGLYRRFMTLNPDVLDAVTAWQVTIGPDGAPVLNRHGDADADAAVVARLGGLAERAVALCDDLAATFTRFESYRPRLAAAMRRVESGDTSWIDGARIDSFHTVWFELHEHLLATLGIERGDVTVEEADSASPLDTTTGVG